MSDYAKPSDAKREEFGPKMSELENCLVIFWPTEFVEQDTRWSEGGPADTVECDLVVLDGPGVLDGEPREHGAYCQTIVVKTLRKYVGGMLPARVIRGKGKGGRTPPYLLVDMIPEDIKLVDAYLGAMQKEDGEVPPF